MRLCRVTGLNEIAAALSGKAAPEIEIIGHGIDGFGVPNTELANEAGVITVLTQQGRVGLGPLCGGERLGEIADAVTAFVLAGENGSPADAADRRRHEMVFEENTIVREAVDVGRFDVGIAHAAERVPPLVVREEEDNVRASNTRCSQLLLTGRVQRPGQGQHEEQDGSDDEVSHVEPSVRRKCGRGDTFGLGWFGGVASVSVMILAN